MAKARPSITKRLREKALMEKRQRKAMKKAERAMEREEGEVEEIEGDPDLAGIVPGPQKPAWIDFVPEDERPSGDD